MSTTIASSSNSNNNGGQNNKPPSKPPGRAPQGQQKCPYCQKGYARTDNLRRHIKAEHEEPDAFPCPYCEVVTKRKDNLDKHVKLHDLVECAMDDCDWKNLAERYIQHLVGDHKIGELLYERAKEAYDDEDTGQGG